jgi:hypothetical protein
MSETTPKPEETPTEDDANKVNDQEASQEPQEAGDKESGQGEQEDDEQNDNGLWDGIDEDHPVRKVVQDLRREAAEKRTQNKTLQDTITSLEEQTREMKSPDEFQQAVAEAQQEAKKANLTAARERVARQHNLPESLIPRLRGDSAEELEADARQLRDDLGLDKKSTTPPRGPLRGGLDPTEQGPTEEQLIEQIRSGGRNF